jgi:hypothetical protein
MQRRGKYVSAATNQHTTIEKPSEAVFSAPYVPNLYSEDQPEKLVSRGLYLAAVELTTVQVTKLPL